MPDPRPVTLISVDIEAAGPSPSDYAMLSLGACLVDDPEPNTRIATSTWNDFDTVYAGLTWDDFDTQWAGATWDDFDRFDWAGQA